MSVSEYFDFTEPRPVLSLDVAVTEFQKADARLRAAGEALDRAETEKDRAEDENAAASRAWKLARADLAKAAITSEAALVDE